jgi:cytochrome b pre-mRNA-processing protein 3
MEPSRQSPPLSLRARRWLRRFRPDAADRAPREVAERVYRDLVKQARSPSFYRDLGVPDTPEGRFEMIGLHVALVVRRLRLAGAPGRALAQELIDLLFADVDEGLRHIGIGDLSVGKHVKRLAGNFYARLRALDDALDAVPGAPLAPMLRTNVYHNAAPPSRRQLAALADYLLAAEAALRAHAGARVLAGDIAWASPEGGDDPALCESSKSS